MGMMEGHREGQGAGREAPTAARQVRRGSRGQGAVRQGQKGGREGGRFCQRQLSPGR